MTVIEEVSPATTDEVLNELDFGPGGHGIMDGASLVYRGCADRSWGLQPSLLRVADAPADEENWLMERFELRHGAYREGDVAVGWELYALAQHYGLPTRLLDWSFLPSVGLHFSTCELDRYDVDGAVWIADFAKVHGRLPDLLQERLHDIKRPFSFADLADLVPTPRDLHRFSTPDHEYGVFFQNPFSEKRIGAQQGLFSAMSSPLTSFDDEVDTIGDCLKVVVVRRELKAEIRRRLDRDGHAEAAFFPDTLDGLCRELRRQVEMRQRGIGVPR